MCLAACVALYARPICAQHFGDTPTFRPDLAQRVFEQTWAIIQDHYVDPEARQRILAPHRQRFEEQVQSATTAEAFYAVMREMVSALSDDHSAFLPPRQARAVQSQSVGSIGPRVFGPAANLRRMPDHCVLVLQTIPNSATAQAVRPGDCIIAANGVVLGSGVSASRLLFGGEGNLELTVRAPGGVTRTVLIEREAFDAGRLPSPVHAQILEDDIGYLAIYDFMSFSTALHVRDALQHMHNKHHLRGVIVDVRANEGGVIGQMLEALGLFISGGSAGSYQLRGNRTIHYTIPISKTLPKLNDLPVVVLVSETTQSAGELFALMMQLHGRARLVGTPTAGNVEMVRDFRLADGSLLWLAVGHYRSPEDKPIENIGVQPDVVLSSAWWHYPLEADPHVRQAIRLIRESH